MIDLKTEMAKLLEPVTTEKPPYWSFWRWDLWQRAQENDPEHFLAWPCIAHTMNQRHWPHVVQAELDMLINDGKFPDVSAPAFPLYELHQRENNIRQAYHLHKWERVTNKKVADLHRIVEIGGGYGAACLMAYRMGFEGEYVIYDLPEFSLLQQFYLERARVTEQWPVILLSELMPFDCDLLVGIYSLSEMPFSQRQEIFDTFHAKSILTLYSGQWQDYDNVSYFQRGQAFGNGWWHHEEATHHNDPGNWYTIVHGGT